MKKMKKQLKMKVNYKINLFNKYILKYYYIMFKKKYSLLKYFGKSKVKKSLRKKSLRRKSLRKRQNSRKRYNKSKKNMRGG